MVTKCLLISVLCSVFAAGVWAADPADMDLSQTRSLPLQSSDMMLLENVIVGNDRYAVIVQLDASLALKPVWAGILSRVEIPVRAVTIDGDDSDWAGLEPVVTDVAGDEDPRYTGMPGTDLAEVYIARDTTSLYFLMKMHDGDPVRDPQTLYVVEFQQYLTQVNTPGDLASIVNYTEQEGWTVEVIDRGPGGAVGPLARYQADHVGIGSGMLEWKVPITALQYPTGTPSPYFSTLPSPQGIENQFVRAYIHPGPHPDASPISDSNDEYTRPMIVNFYE